MTSLTDYPLLVFAVSLAALWLSSAIGGDFFTKRRALEEEGRGPRHSIWTGSPQWQIEALRRLEIPEDMQKQHGFAPLGPADAAVKNAILAKNGFRVFGYDQHAALATPDRLAALKADYEKNGPGRSNLRYGFVARLS